MKKIVLGIILAFSYASSATAQPAPTCASFTNEADLVTAINNNSGFLECSATPEFARFNVFEIALCTMLPDVGSTSSCDTVFAEPSGRDIDISSSTSISLSESASLSEETYTHAYLILGNEVGAKVSVDFGFTLGAWFNDSPQLEGTTCWTDGTDTKSDFSVTRGNVVCGNSPNPELSIETLYYLGDTSHPFVSYDNNPSTSGLPFNIRLLNDNLQLAAVPTSFNIDPPNDASRIMIALTLPSPSTVTASSTAIEVGFRATNMVSFAMTNCSDPTQACANNVFITGLGFYANVR
jgi:hypothetical protein